MNAPLKSGNPQDSTTKPQTPHLTFSASVFSDSVTINPDQPGNFRSFRFFHFLIASLSTKDKPRIVVVARRLPAEVFEAASKWWTKWIHRSTAALLWAIFASYLFAKQHGLVGWLFERYWEPGKSAWEGLALATLIALLLVGGHIWGPKKAGLAALYILFFPIVAIFIIGAKLFSALGMLSLVVRSVGSISVTGANWILIAVAAVAIDRTSASWLVVICTIYLGISALYIVLSNFYWVTTPFESVVRFAEWTHRLAAPAVESAQQELIELVSRYSSSKPEAKAQVRNEILKKADTIHGQAKYALIVAQKAATISGGKIVLFYIFAFRFLAALLALIVVFAGIYRGIHRLFPEAFSGGGMKSLWFSFYYSVVTFFTVGDGAVSPQGTVSQIAVVAQVMLAVVTLTILALSFSTLSVDLAQENGTAVERVARLHFEYCMGLMRRRLGVTKETPADAITDLKSNFDKHIRRARRNKEQTDLKTKMPAADTDQQEQSHEEQTSSSSEPTEQD